MMDTLSNAKVRLMLRKDTAFYISVLLQLDVYFSEEVDTAATNGLYIKFNPNFFNALNKDEQIFLLMHEVLHVAYMHKGRLEDKDLNKWNQATDHCINLFLIKQGYTFIKGGLADPIYAGMSADEIYALLPDSSESNSLGNDLVPCDTADVSKIEDMVVQAVQAAQMQKQEGSVPKDISRWVHDKLYPQLPWEVLLAKYISTKAEEDFSWLKRNNYYADFYAPDLYSEQLDLVAVYVDCSCSVTQQEFDQYLAEILAIKETLNPKTLEVVSFDTKINSVQVIEDSASFDISLVGGGGTCLTDVAKRVNSTKPDVCILFTDGHYNPVDYNKEVLHIIVDNEGYKNKQDMPVIHIGIGG